MKLILIVLSYFLGSIPSGVIVARLTGGADPRTEGSGNIGATNVLRTLGAGAAVATLAGDVLKGVIPVVLAKVLFPSSVDTMYLAGAAVIAGHDFSVFLRFKGGKGVATTIGSLLALSPPVAGLCIITWITVVGITRYSSAGAIVSALASPFFALLFDGSSGLILFCLAAAALLVAKHRQNIGRILEGTEKRVSFKNRS